MPEIDPSTRSVTRSATRRLAWSVALAAGIDRGGVRHGADLRAVRPSRRRPRQAPARPRGGRGAGPRRRGEGAPRLRHRRGDRACSPPTATPTTTTTRPPRTPSPGPPATSTWPDTQDPTTPLQAAVGAGTVAQQRNEPSPKLVPLSQRSARRTVPESRYAMAGGCYALKSQRTGKWVGRNGEGFRAAAGSYSGGLPLHFQATDLGRYLLYGDRPDFVSQHNGRARQQRPGRVDGRPEHPLRLDRRQERRQLPVPHRREVPQRRRRRRPGPRHPQGAVPDAHDQRLRPLGRGRRRRQRAALRRCLADAGGPRPRRRAHPRHGVRVPRW